MMSLIRTVSRNRRRAIRGSMLVCALWAAAHAGRGESLHVTCYNAESGGADVDVVAKVIEETDGCDLWGLSEVFDEKWAVKFEAAAESGENADFKSILGKSGRNDRLLILYNAARLELVEKSELDHMNPGGRVRAPLVAQLRVKKTGAEFLFVVNHLYRKEERSRHRQARQLNAWGSRATLPIIAVGDYNFDWDIEDGERKHDKGYDELTAGNVFRWVRPKSLIPTQYSPKYLNVLDFVFVAGGAKDWRGTCEIVKVEGDFPDTMQTSDHRPVRAVFELPER